MDIHQMVSRIPIENIIFKVLFDPTMRPKHIKLLLIRVDLGVIAMKG